MYLPADVLEINGGSQLGLFSLSPKKNIIPSRGTKP